MERFNLYKKMEESLEVIPIVKPEVHFEINDCAKKLLLSEALSQDEIGTLEIIFDALQDLEAELIIRLEILRSTDVISTEEFLITANYFLVAHQVGPYSKALCEAFQSMEGIEATEDMLAMQSIPEYTKTVLKSVHQKIWQ